MKTTLILGGIVIVIIGGAFIPFESEVVNETIEIEKVIEVNTLDKRINEAIESAKASTTEKAEKAYNDIIAREEQRIKDEVKTKYITEIESTISSDSPY